MTSKAEELNKRIETLLKQKEAAEAKAAKQAADIEAADNAAIEAAAEAARTAIKSNDVLAYDKAKADEEAAKAAKETHRKFLVQVKIEPLITDAEFHEAVDGVLKEIEAKDKARKARAAELITELEKIAEEDRAEIRFANDTLARWQYKILGIPESPKRPLPRYYHGELPCYVDGAMHRNEDDYKAITGRKLPESTFKGGLYNGGIFR